MKRGLAIVIVIAATAVAIWLLWGRGCTATEGSGGSRLDVSMGGKVMSTDALSFKPVSLSGTSLVIENTAPDRSLDIGAGTPILNGDGSEAARVRNSIAISPGGTGTLILSSGLAAGATYYLGAPLGGSKPTVRQLFICPGSEGGSGGGGYQVPGVDDVDVPE